MYIETAVQLIKLISAAIVLVTKLADERTWVVFKKLTQKIRKILPFDRYKAGDSGHSA